MFWTYKYKPSQVFSVLYSSEFGPWYNVDGYKVSWSVDFVQDLCCPKVASTVKIFSFGRKLLVVAHGILYQEERKIMKVFQGSDQARNAY